MPYFIPISVKIALGIGTAAGAAIAFANNRERILEGAEYILQRGADYCKERLEEVKHTEEVFADAYADHELNYERNDISDEGLTSGFDRHPSSFSDSEEKTTPNSSDDSDNESDYDGSKLEIDPLD